MGWGLLLLRHEADHSSGDGVHGGFDGRELLGKIGFARLMYGPLHVGAVVGRATSVEAPDLLIHHPGDWLAMSSHRDMDLGFHRVLESLALKESSRVTRPQACAESSLTASTKDMAGGVAD